MTQFDGPVWVRHALRTMTTSGLIDRAVVVAVVAAGGRPTLDGLAGDSGLDIELVRPAVEQMNGLGLVTSTGQAIMPALDPHQIAEQEYRERVLAVKCNSCRARPLDPCRSSTSGAVVGFHALRARLAAAEASAA